MRTEITETQKDAAPELEAAFVKGDLIVVCWEPGCKMHRLPHWQEQEWVTRPQKKGYRNYSHSICRSHYRVYQQEINRFITDETAAFSASTTNIAAA